MSALQKLAARYPQKRILITGATAGLGEALALQFAGAGFRVGVASRNPEKVAATARKVEQAGGESLEITLDVTRLEDFRAAAATVDGAWGGLDMLVNNAGIATAGKIRELDLQVWQQSLDTDLWSVIHGCREFLALLEQAGGGHIVNVASAAGLLNGPDVSTYNVAKAGVISLSETLKVELAEQNIDVTVCCPTVFRSSLFDTRGHEGDVFEGVTAKGLKRDMETTSISSDDIARHLIGAMARGRMYSVPQWDAKINWLLARLFPETFRRIVLYMYRHRLWVFRQE